MAALRIPLVLLLLLLLFLTESAVAGNSGFHCPAGDTNCYVSQQKNSSINSPSDPCGASDFKPLTKKVLLYLMTSSSFRASLNDASPVVIAESPPRLSASQTACWAGRRNASLSKALTDAPTMPTMPTGQPTPDQDRLKVATVMANATTAVGVKTVVVTLVEPTSLRPLMCETQLSASASLRTNADVAAYVCYELLGKCYFVTRRTTFNWSDAMSHGCEPNGKLALAEDVHEEALIRSFVQTLNLSTEYYIHAQECSPEYVMPFSNETLTEFAEPLSLAPGEQFRVTRFPACVRINITSGDLTMEHNCTLNSWICYRTVPMSVNRSMCGGSYCHAFWNFNATRSTAVERCPAALIGVAELKELTLESNYIPVQGNSGHYLYHTGIKKHPISNRTFFLNTNTTSGKPVKVMVQNADQDLQQHCLQLHVNSTHTFGVFAARCDDRTNATMLFCQFPNRTMQVYTAEEYLTFRRAKTRCEEICGSHQCRLPTQLSVSNQTNQTNPVTSEPESSSDGILNGIGKVGTKLVESIVNLGSSVFPSNGISTFWLDGYEYQNWTDADGQPMYDFYLHDGNILAKSNYMNRFIYDAGAFNAEECALFTVTVYSNGTKEANLHASFCDSLSYIACRSAASCAQPPPSYSDGYLSGIGWYNLSTTSLVVDMINANCSGVESGSTHVDSSVYYTCNLPAAGSLSAVIPVVYSTCQMKPGSMNWSELSNTSTCRSSQCDLRRLFSMGDADNQRFLRLFPDGGASSTSWLVANRTNVEAICLPGAKLVPANLSFASQYAVAPSAYCSSDRWMFNVSYFCNATTLAIDVMEQPAEATPLYRCRRVRCPLSNLFNISTINTTGLDPGAFMEVGESVQVSCSNASDPSIYIRRPLLSVQCLLYANHSYEFAVTFSDNGSSNAATKTNGSSIALQADFKDRCVNQALRTCYLTQELLQQRYLVVVNDSSTGWPYPRQRADYLPPNASLVIACNRSRVNDRSLASINQRYHLLCAADGEIRVTHLDGPNDNSNSSLNITCAFETCPAFSTPPRTEVAGVLDAAGAAMGANWTRNSTKTAVVTMETAELPPGYQLLVRCSLAPDAFQTVVCNDTGRVWLPLPPSDNRSLWQSAELLNCTGLGKAAAFICYRWLCCY